MTFSLAETREYSSNFDFHSRFWLFFEGFRSSRNSFARSCHNQKAEEKSQFLVRKVNYRSRLRRHLISWLSKLKASQNASTGSKHHLCCILLLSFASYLDCLIIYSAWSPNTEQTVAVQLVLWRRYSKSLTFNPSNRTN